MVTVAFDQVILVIANNGGSLTGGPTGLFGIPPGLATGELFIIAAVCVVLVSQLERRSLGRSLEAIRTDENLAKSMGFAVVRDRNFIFALSAALGGLSGAMDATNFSTFGTTAFSFNLVVTGLTMAVVGGVGSWVGAVIGAVFVTWFPDIATVLSGTWQSIIYGILIILVVTYEPGGVYGLLRRAVRLLMSKRRRSPAAAAVAGQPLPRAAADQPHTDERANRVDRTVR
jgi:branched-chain amino acid transport system permease protein